MIHWRWWEKLCHSLKRSASLYISILANFFSVGPILNCVVVESLERNWAIRSLYQGNSEYVLLVPLIFVVKNHNRAIPLAECMRPCNASASSSFPLLHWIELNPLSRNMVKESVPQNYAGNCSWIGADRMVFQPVLAGTSETFNWIQSEPPSPLLLPHSYSSRRYEAPTVPPPPPPTDPCAPL